MVPKDKVSLGMLESTSILSRSASTSVRKLYKDRSVFAYAA